MQDTKSHSYRLLMTFTSLAFVFCMALPVPLLAQIDLTDGTWYNEQRTGRVQFFEEESKLSGKIIWLKNDQVKDKENPDTKLRDRPILGITALRGFVSRDNKTWTGGKIYDPETGKTYSSKITMVNKNELELRGYIGTPLLGRSTKFIRAD
jgi:uncharacterized protein (DUF2147 family)